MEGASFSGVKGAGLSGVQPVRRLRKSYEPAALEWAEADHRYVIVREILLRGDEAAARWPGRFGPTTATSRPASSPMRTRASGSCTGACRRAGPRQVGWQMFRHTLASHLVLRGAPLEAVQELPGHASMVMTMRYAHLSPDARRDAVGLLDLTQTSRQPDGNRDKIEGN
jgi:hypothetical protein